MSCPSAVLQQSSDICPDPLSQQFSHFCVLHDGLLSYQSPHLTPVPSCPPSLQFTLSVFGLALLLSKFLTFLSISADTCFPCIEYRLM